MSWLNHFRKEEHPFIERALDWLDQVDHQHRERLTDFLDPRQFYILRALMAKYPHVNCTPFGGYAEAERCRVILHQDYYVPSQKDFSLSGFEVTSPTAGFQQLKHKDFLGSLLGCGLKRDKFGDILVHPGRAQVIVAQEIADYLHIHLNQVHRVPVVLEPIDLSAILPHLEEWKQMHITVPSPRADVVVGDVFRLSRSKVLPPIKAGHLKINWMVVDSPTFSLKEGDMISLRGYGRFKILKEEGTTKKGNIRFEVGILASR